MRYYCKDEELVRLVNEPLENGLLSDRFDARSFAITSTALKLGAPSAFFNVPRLENLLVGAFLQLAHHGREELALLRNHLDTLDDLPRHARNPDSPVEAAARTDQMLQKANRLVFAMLLEDEENLTEKGRQVLKVHIEQWICCEYSYTNDRIEEKAGIGLSGRELIDQYPSLWTTFYFSEILYLILIGELHAQVVARPLSGSLILIGPQSAKRVSHRIHWLNSHMENNSAAGDSFEITTLDWLFGSKVYVTGNLAQPIIQHFVDKVFSLNFRLLEEELPNSLHVKVIKECVLFALCVEYRYTKGESTPSNYLLQHIEISQEAVWRLESMLRQRPARTAPPILLRYICFENGNFLKGEVNPELGIRKLIGCALDLAPGDRGKFGNTLGKFFENICVRAYLKNLSENEPTFPYEVAERSFEPGRKSGKTARAEGYDADIVLRARESDEFVFIQTKHWLSDNPIFLGERVRSFASDKTKKAISQITSLKENIGSDRVKRQLALYDLEGAHEKNSYFLFLHNLPHLNYLHFSGVLMYEWRVFRNLLLGNRVFSRGFGPLGESGSTGPLSRRKISDQTHFYSATADFRQPEFLVEEQFKRADAYGEQLRRDWALYERTIAAFKVANFRYNTVGC